MTTLAKAQRYIADPNNLYQQFKKGSFTKDLEVLQKISLDDAGSIKVQSNSYTGESQGYDGYGSVSYDAADVIKANTGWVIYQLNQKRYYPMPIDAIEAEESLNNFVSRVNGLLKYKVAVDIDTYRFSKLINQAGAFDNGGVDPTTGKFPETPVDLAKGNILQTLEADLALMANEEVTDMNYTLYATPDTIRILEDADKLTRFINSREVEAEGIGYKIRYIETSNGRIEIQSIPKKYFHAFTLGTQTTINSNAVGTVLADFRYLLLTKQAVNAVVKVNVARIMPSGTIRGFLGDLFELFLYHDIFVIERHKAVGAIDGNFLTDVAFNGVIANRLLGTTTLTYNANGGTIASGGTKTVAIGMYFADVTAKPTATYAAHTFVGWALDAAGTKPVDDSVRIKANQTVYAMWVVA